MCYNPMIMKCIVANNMGELMRLKDLGFKVNMKDFKAYRLMSTTSRDLKLEDIETWQNQEDIEIGCGGCIQCRLEKARDWAVRCTLEAKKSPYNYFITLSYDDDNIVKGRLGNGTLNPDHAKQFIKSLRKKFARLGHQGIKFLLAGEYGDNTFRPHYHAILFNCPIPDLTIDFKDKEGNISRHKNKLGQYMMYSQFIRDIWKYGNITIDDANYNTESYVSRYIMKKQTGVNKDIYEKDLGIYPPFLRMSLKPGIGADYLDSNIEDIKTDPHFYIGRDGKKPIVSGLPRYFKKRLFLDDPEFKDLCIEKAKDGTEKNRSLLRGHQLINVNRRIRQDNFEAKKKSFVRDF